MDALSFLATTTEVSITFAGFISIFVILARRDGSFEPDVALLIRLVLIASITGLFSAALPAILSTLSIEGPTLWRLSSAIVLAGAVGVSVYVFRRRSLIQRSVLVPVAVTFNGAVLVLLLANLSEWPSAPDGGTYVVSVWLVLGIGSINFVDLVFNRVLGQPVA